MIEPAHLVGVGGALGAMLRYLVAEQLPSEEFPFGTLTVNVLGSLVLGLATFMEPGSDALLFLGVGVCGAFTTFSSFAYDTVRMWETGQPYRAVVYALANLIGAILAVVLGQQLSVVFR